jgi:hypothetical protein
MPNNATVAIVNQANLAPIVSDDDRYQYLQTLFSQPQVIDAGLRLDLNFTDIRPNVFTNEVVVTMMTMQALDSMTCKRAVQWYNSVRTAQGLPEMSTNTASYCNARNRLSLDYVKYLARYIAANTNKRAEANNWIKNVKCKGRNVYVIDGSTAKASDTEKNQAAYPQHGKQQPGSGFPIFRILFAFSLDTGSLIDLAVAPAKGKETGELALFRQVLDNFKEGDVLVLDALFSNFWVIAECQKRGIDFVMEGHGSRNFDFSKGEILGPFDHRVTYHKPKAMPEWMTKEIYDSYPDTIVVREVKEIYTNCKGIEKSINIVTSFCNPADFSSVEIADLYGLRWSGAETNIYCFKTLLGAEMINAKTPEMIHKVLWTHVIGLNVARGIMLEAAIKHKKPPVRLQFTAAIGSFVTRSVNLISKPNTGAIDSLLNEISKQVLPERGLRNEPRVIKTRPKPRELLKGSRYDQSDPVVLAKEGRLLRKPEVYGIAS